MVLKKRIVFILLLDMNRKSSVWVATGSHLEIRKKMTADAVDS